MIDSVGVVIEHIIMYVIKVHEWIDFDWL